MRKEDLYGIYSFKTQGHAVNAMKMCGGGLTMW